MIEDNIIKYIDLGETMQNLDVYSKKSIIILFKIFENMLSYKINNELTFIILKLIFFLQLMACSFTKMPASLTENDYVIQLFNSIKYVLTPHRNVTDKNSFKTRLYISIFFCLVLIFCIIYLIIVTFCYKNNNFFKFPIKLLNILNLILNNYALCPLINIMMIIIRCSNGKHKYLEIKCYELEHLIYLVITLFLLITLLTYSFFLSLYYYEIGTIQDKNHLCRTNCYYETLENILSEFCFFSSYIVFHYMNDDKIYRLIYKIIILLNCLIIAIYYHKKVFYFNHKLNIISINGWYFTIWYLILLLIKELFEVINILILLIIGWLIIILFNYFNYHYTIMKCLTESYIFDTDSIKYVEMFSFYLLEKANENIIASKVLLKGIINSFEEYLTTSIELNEQYQKFLDNLYLIKRFGNKETPIFKVYNITFLIYEFFFEKQSIKNDMLLIICYFLVNKLENYTYAALLCSQIKVSDHKTMYLKYLLMEKIKKFQMYKLLRTGSKESIRHVELGSVIVYNNYLDIFKIKIYDAACNQIDYFDSLKNNQTNKNLTSSFMETGEKILTLRDEIIDLWNKIMKLNPFCEENEKDYLLYLDTIIQDSDLALKEEEKYIQYRNSILSQKNNLYYSLFNKEVSSIILVDGYALRGKILYSTPNFSILFNFLPKEIINLYIYDLMPSVIADFHKEIENESVKYSNLIDIFTKKLKIVLKGKNNCIFNVSIYVKCLPNLSHGLIYILDIDKLQDKSFIMILDKDFKINCLSDAYSISNGTDFAVNSSKLFDLNSSIIGHHIGIIMPEILMQFEYKDDKFKIKKENIELKAILFPNLIDNSESEKILEIIIDKIKISGKLISEEQVHINHNQHESTTKASLRNRKTIMGVNNQEYKELLLELSKKFAGKSYNVFYKIIKKSFLNEKYHYYKILIDNGIINEEVNNTNINLNAVNKPILNLNETKISLFNNTVINQLEVKEKIKAIKFQITEEQNDNNENNKENKNNEKEVVKNNEDGVQINNDNANFEQTHNSLLSTNSSIDNSSFSRLKIGIMNKEEPLIITYMKIILFLFNIASIVLILIDCLKINDKFSGVDIFLEENLFFNFSKISADCFFIAGVNLKYKQYKVNNLCYGETCDYLYNEFLFLCINPLKEILEHSANYNKEYQKKLTERYIFILSTYDEFQKVETTFDTINTLRMFLTSSLYLYHHYDDFLNNDGQTYALLENIVYGSYYYITALSYIKGFDENERRKLVNKKFKTNKLYLIINVVICVFVVVGLSYLISKLFKVEKYFLQKLIKFQNPKFDQYIKYLENLKKKLRNDNGEEEDLQNQDENNHPNNSNESEDYKHFARKGSANSIDPKKRKNEHKKKGKKRMQGKISKLQQQKNEKIKIMSSYFFRNNLILGIELGLILLIYMTYYILINLIYTQKRNNFFEFDDIINNLEGIYKTCFDIYVNIKYEALNYIIFITNQNKAISKLENGESEVEFEGVNYTDVNKLKSQYYEINIPDVSFNKIGNLLLTIVSNSNNDYSSITNADYSTQITQLYQGNACEVLYKITDEIYQYCSGFWSSILTQGMEQAFNQLGVELSALQNDLKMCNKLEKSFLDIIQSDNFAILEYYYTYYFMDAYLKTKSLLEDLRKDKVNGIYIVFEITMVTYIIISIILWFILVIFVQNKKKVFCSFLNFIGIIPFQYISEDEDFYRDILKLEKELF